MKQEAQWHWNKKTKQESAQVQKWKMKQENFTRSNQRVLTIFGKPKGVETCQKSLSRSLLDRSYEQREAWELGEF